MHERNLIILGAGPAGLTAGIYAARSELRPLILTGMQPGGMLTMTMLVENFPGFPEGVPGAELMQRIQAQAERCGAEIAFEEATKVELEKHPFHIATDVNEYTCLALIIATGAVPRRLGLPSEEKFIGRGVSTCATCDGFLYKGKVVCVIGGGDSAMEEALHLTHHASKIYVIHRRNELRASKILQQRALSHPKIEFIWNSIVTDILGDERVTGVRIRNVKTDEESNLQVDGVFLAIGHEPNTALFREQLELDERGYIITDEFQRTSVPMVFAAGDVQDKVFRQAITAAASGCRAAIMAQRYLQELEQNGYPPPSWKGACI
ncbi:MAG TPA: thioredoxin-disulfide reductase [Armatimonadetes bacterium]|nr:thioredoxin-disulfide reductase [Armatimonadota bacterium]